ncbi:PREDICTED: uncharacterized protein LOC105557081 [Vollenhovia emeryi]|uniref:uncharacterized protein LOC105557081 n=1 Tax=Vollenhovia emeryi TaxID=411798 RepID=UPI0005F4B651|nr:PREDICTED: uncharacterized protein LOC105557081 [Vollenhovia emeryi]
MSLVIEPEPHSGHRIVYLPHHGVIKEDSSSTKLRAVFDASSKTSSGQSLNDILRVGPTIQGSLLEIVVRFRFFRVALTADIQKMYRQVLVHPDDRDYQRILWRFDPTQPVEEFRLNTVTYGEASSAFLAINCIYKLAKEARQDFPMASNALLHQTYVDDILACADSVEAARLLQKQLTTVLSAGGFKIHKWCSDREEALEGLPPHLRESASKLGSDANDTIKTLGIKWSPKVDQFQFFVQGAEAAKTKREVLSAISRIFDPLGLIGPILTTAKLIMQETWRSGGQWDESLPILLAKKWEQFRRDLNDVQMISIPRRVIPSKNTSKIYLHGFCDASAGACGACLYVQAEDEQGTYTSRLLCSKSRIAPIKPISIPRLELCSAVLLARLIDSVRRNLKVHIDGILAWSDSQVTLCWIRGDVTRWKPFVANRVSEIIELLSANRWNYVKGPKIPLTSFREALLYGN